MSPERRRRFGVVSTPPELVGYVVRSAHKLAQQKLGLPEGLADPEAFLLDPAAGGMEFLLAAWELALAGRGPEEAAALLRDRLLPRSRGLEKLPERAAEGRAAVRRFLKGRGVEPPGRLPLLLADALEGPGPSRVPPGSVPIVFGNPPWRGHSENRGAWARSLLDGYTAADGREDKGCFRVQGEPIGENNRKWLQGDAVKFLRLAQRVVDGAGGGLAVLVLPSSLLDGPTFRGLRHSLLEAFDEVRLLDLHGGRSENVPGDENVFSGVTRGVAVFHLVKRPRRPSPRGADFFHRLAEELGLTLERVTELDPTLQKET